MRARPRRQADVEPRQCCNTAPNHHNLITRQIMDQASYEYNNTVVKSSNCQLTQLRLNRLRVMLSHEAIIIE